MGDTVRKLSGRLRILANALAFDCAVLAVCDDAEGIGDALFFGGVAVGVCKQ